MEKTIGEEIKNRYTRRILLEKLIAKGQNKIINNIIKRYGCTISIEDYKEYTKKLEKQKTFFK
ncbi:MAG: hypothetical protein QXS02_03220 [Candidatus Thermoplasmatota archaeon]